MVKKILSQYHDRESNTSKVFYRVYLLYHIKTLTNRGNGVSVVSGCVFSISKESGNT
jgi:hypothetical protein